MVFRDHERREIDAHAVSFVFTSGLNRAIIAVQSSHG